jgi:LmbE family N-acetylglucosaminyl deacetylase
VTDDQQGGLAAVFAHPDDESFGCAGAMALGRDAGRPVRLLVVTRGEAGSADGTPDEDLVLTREEELRGAARAIGLDEVTMLEGYADGGVAERPFEELVEEIGIWLEARRPQAVITFGSHGVTGHPDHIAVGNATRWAVEQLSDGGIAPNAVYVIAPIFGPGRSRYDLSPEEAAATHRIDISSVAERKLAALRAHASQADTAEAIADLKAAISDGGPIYEGYTRVRPIVPAPHPRFDERLL